VIQSWSILSRLLPFRNSKIIGIDIEEKASGANALDAELISGSQDTPLAYIYQEEALNINVAGRLPPHQALLY
jgi:hypothetical protein